MEPVLLTAAVVLLIVHLASVALCLRRLDRPQKACGILGQPRITLLRPVCGLDPQDAETLESSFLQDYPDYEIVFCAPTENDPAVALLRQLIARYPQVTARILTGQVTRTGNPKLDNLWKGWQAADAGWICMADSNLLLPPDYLAQVAAAWDEDTGLVSSPAWGAAPCGLAARLEAAFLNGNQGRLQLAADSLGQGFAQGKTLFWNRALLDRAGGLAALGDRLAEDVAATHLVRGMGLSVRLTPHPFAQPLGRRGLVQVWARQLRWSRVRRDGFPLLFLTEPLNGSAAPVVLLALAGAGPVSLTALALVWYAAEWRLMQRAGWPASWRDALVLPLRDLLLPGIWLATFLRRGITWRGTDLAVPEAGPQPEPSASSGAIPAAISGAAQ